MSETHKKTLAERKRKRRGYLLQAASIRIFGSVALGIQVGSEIMVLAGFAFLCLSIIFQSYVLGYIAMYGLSIFVITACICRVAHRYFDRASESLAHIPTVQDQIADLPAEDILVRGSDQPAASPAELLRAAHEGIGTEPHELLRPEPELADQELQQIGAKTE